MVVIELNILTWLGILFLIQLLILNRTNERDFLLIGVGINHKLSSSIEAYEKFFRKLPKRKFCRYADKKSKL